MTANLLIIGNRPPPIGGVTIHVDRLCLHLEERDISFRYLDPRSAGALGLLRGLWWARVCHVHLSNFYVVLIIAVLSRLLRTHSVVTFHGDLFRKMGWRKFLPRLAARFCSVPIVLNARSYELVKTINTGARWISSYIPPVGPESLDPDIIELINAQRRQGRLIAATNAFRYILDQKGRETYGIVDLINHAIKLDYALVLSDPSATYHAHIEDRLGAIPENVVIISRQHSFYALLKHVDVFIRNTTTDGDSVSVHEALDQGKTVYCTDVVDRPAGVITYTSLETLKPDPKLRSYDERPDVVGELTEIYRSLGSHA